MGVALNFNARSVEPSTGQADAIPAGWYNALIESSENKPTKDGSGAMLVLTFKVVDGAYAGRKLFSRLNLQNNNPQAVEIAYKDLSAICHAVGVLDVADSAQLHNLPMKLKVSLKPARQDRNAQTGAVVDYEASNDIKAYKNINEQVGTTGAVPAGFTAPPAFGAPPAAPAAPAAPAFAAPAPTPQAPAWQAPAAAQPWAGAPAQAPAPVQQAPAAAPAPTFAPPPAQPAPGFAAPAPVGQPAWMAQAPAGGAPAWASAPPPAQ